jgi:pyruvate formate lyase activating enzyme
VCPEKAACLTADGRVTMVTERCVHCGACTEVCPSRARRVYGKSMSVVEVFEEIYKDLPFYRRSGGGVTLSGGEPLLQKDFTHSLIEHCARHNIHTAVETCGHAPWETVAYAFEYTDLILFDFKHRHPLKHLKFTGINNTQILRNLKRLDAEGRSLIIRVPVIPGVNATEEEMKTMADFAAGLKRSHPCHLLPYHAMGHSKYSHLGLNPRFQTTEAPSDEQMNAFCEIWKSRGLEVQIGG